MLVWSFRLHVHVSEILRMYAVGHFGQGGTSAVQTALAMMLREHLSVSGSVFLFDPVLTENERTAAEAVGFTLIDENEVRFLVAKPFSFSSLRISSASVLSSCPRRFSKHYFAPVNRSHPHRAKY